MRRHADSLRDTAALTGALVLWAAIYGWLIVGGGVPVLDGALFGPDSYMRMVRVTQLHATGAWYDDTVLRSNAPFGDRLHWTRPLDLLLLAGAFALRPFLEFNAALFWTGALISPIAMLAAALTVGWAARPLVGVGLGHVAMLLLFLQWAVVGYAYPGRADHHAILILLTAVNAGQTIRLLGPCQPRRLALLAGATSGLGLWISVEYLVQIATILAILGFAWLQRGKGRAGLNLSYTVSAALVLAIALVVERPPPEWFVVEYDTISIVHVVVILAIAVAWAVIQRTERHPVVSDTPLNRVGLAAIATLAVCVIVYATYPRFFLGPTADVSPALASWLARIDELKPISIVGEPGKAFLLIGSALLSLPFVGVLIWTNRRTDKFNGWLFVGLLLFVYTTMSLVHARAAPFTALPAVIVLAAGLGWFWRHTLRMQGFVARASLRATGLLAIIFGPTLAGAAATDTDPATQRAICDLRRTSTALSVPAETGAGPWRIATSPFYGPELLYRTEHAVVATPYHRNHEGLLENYRFFNATEDETSRRIAAERRISVVLVCEDEPRRFLHEAVSEQDTLYARLSRGVAPSWLEPMEMTPDTDPRLRLYRVVESKT